MQCSSSGTSTPQRHLAPPPLVNLSLRLAWLMMPYHWGLHPRYSIRNRAMAMGERRKKRESWRRIESVVLAVIAHYCKMGRHTLEGLSRRMELRCSTCWWGTRRGWRRSQMLSRFKTLEALITPCLLKISILMLMADRSRLRVYRASVPHSASKSL